MLLVVRLDMLDAPPPHLAPEPVAFRSVAAVGGVLVLEVVDVGVVDEVAGLLKGSAVVERGGAVR